MQGSRCITLAIATILSSTLLPAVSQAEDLAITIRPSGLSQIAEATKQFFPSQIEVPTTLERQIVDCPFTEEETVITVDDIVAAVEWNDLALRVDEGMLVVDANIDFDIDLHMSAVNFYACFGSIDCETSLSTSGIGIVAHLALMSGEDGKVSLANSKVDVNLEMADFELDVEGCVLGNLLEVVTDLLGNWVLDQLETPAERAIGNALSKKVAGLGFVLPDQIDRNGFQLEASLNQLELINSEGIKILGDVVVVGPAGPVEASRTDTTAEALPTSFSDGGIALAVTDSLVTKSLAEAFVAGRFDSVLADAVPTIELSQEGLSQKLGLPQGTTVDVSLNLGSAPTVSFGRKDDTQARVALSDLQIEITINSPGAQQGRVTVQADVVLDAGFVVTDGALAIRVQGLDFEKLKISTGGDSTLEPDPVRLQQFIRDVAVPMLSARLSNLPLAPVLQPMEGTFVWMRGLEAEGGWLRMGVDLVMPDLGDKTAPETSLPSTRLVAAGMAAIAVNGSDNSTPAPLLRYTAWLDGELLTEKPTFLNMVHFSAADGEHVLEVAAHDLNGNVDDTPSRLELVVDGTPPELFVESFPEAVIADGIVAASWRAMDDKGTAKTRWEIRVADGGAVQKIVASGEGAASGTLRVQALSESDIYVLHLIAEDEAGNITSKEYGFAFEQGGGCSAAGQGGGAWLLALALLVGFRRRRRRVVVPAAAAMVAVLGAGDASAQTAGNALTGVTDTDGASAFWNPAALAPGKGTMVDLTTNLTMIDLEYDNPNTAGSSSARIPKPQPMLGAYTDKLGKKWRLGFTMGVPYTAGPKWSRDDAEGQTTRYYAVSAKLVHAILTPAASYQVSDRIALGFGLNIDYASINANFDKDFAAKLNASAGGSADSPFPAGSPELAAPVNFSMSGVGVGAVGGLFVQPSERLKFGLSVHSPITAKASGNLEANYPMSMVQFIADAAPGAELPEVAGKAELDLKVPLAVFMGAAYEPARSWEVSVDYRFVNYANDSNADILISQATSPDLKDAQIVRGQNNRHSIGLRVNKSFLAKRALVALRGRYENNKVAERTFTPSNLDFEKVELSVTLRWAVNQRWAVAAQYSKFLMSSVDVDESLHRPVTDSNLDVYNHPAPLGTYSADADMLSVGVTMKM